MKPKTFHSLGGRGSPFLRRVPAAVRRHSRLGLVRFLAVAAGIVFLAGCGPKKTPTPAAPPAPEVGVVSVALQSIPITTELQGRMEAVRLAEVRARATGIL